MPKIRLLIKRPERENRCIPVTVEGTDLIGNCISSLVDYLQLPRRDHLGRVLTYSLRPLSGGQPLSRTLRFADVQLLPEARLVLEAEEAHVVGWPLDTLILGRSSVHSPGGDSPLNPLRQIVSRRAFVVGSMLTGCAGSGLLIGIATAFTTRGHALPLGLTPPATTPSQIPALLEPILFFSDHQRTVRALAWSPDGRMVASGDDGGWLLLWTSNGQVQQRVPHSAGVAALAWGPSGKILASGSGSHVRFFDGRSATPLAPARRVHTKPITSLAWSNATGYPLVSGSLDKRSIIWETSTYQPQAFFTRHTAAIDALSCQLHGAAVASASQGGVIRVWDADTLVERHNYIQDATVPLHAIAFAPTGNQLVVGGDDGYVLLWENGLVCQQSRGTTGNTLCLDVPLRFRAHSAPVLSLSWSPDGRFFATGGEDGTFALWSPAPGKIPTLLTQTSYADPVTAIAWSFEHGQVAVASGNKMTIWNIQM